MQSSEPYFKIGEGAVPAENLKDKGKGKPKNMNDPYCFTPHAQERAEYQEEYPEKMYPYCNICKYLVKHYIQLLI